MGKVTDVLNVLKARAGVDAVVLTTEDGLVVDGVGEPDTDMDAIAAYAASYASVSARMADESQFGPVDSVLIDAPGRAVVIAPVDATVVAALVGSGGMQLGNMRVQLRRSLKELAAALAEEAQASFTSPTTDPADEGPGPDHGNGAGNGAATLQLQDVPVKLG